MSYLIFCILASLACYMGSRLCSRKAYIYNTKNPAFWETFSTILETISGVFLAIFVLPIFFLLFAILIATSI